MGAEASKRGLSQDELDEIRNNTRFENKEIQEWHDKFLQDFPGGEIDEDQFIEMFLKMSPKQSSKKFARNVFKAYDKDGNGVIDFQEFMVTLSVSSRGTPDEKLKWAFDMYDINKDGMVSLDEVIEMMGAIYRMQGETRRNFIEDAAQNIFQQLDKNKDGQITLDEFINGAVNSESIMNALKGN